MTLEQKVSWKCTLCIQRSLGHLEDSAMHHRGDKAMNMSPQNNQDAQVLLSSERVSKTTPQNESLEFTDLKSLMLTIRKFHKDMRQELGVLNATLKKLSKRMDTCEARLDQFCNRTGHSPRLSPRRSPGRSVKQHKDYEKIVQQLKNDLNEREQELLANDIEITGIQEEAGEKLDQIVVSLINKLGVELHAEDMVSAARIGSPNRQRPRPIIVRLSRRSLRDQCLKEARVRRDITTNGTGIPGPPRRFHVKERLTRVNRQLYLLARDMANHHKWKYVWTNKGKIYVRKSSGPDALTYRIRMESDIHKAFRHSTVGTNCQQ